MFTSPDLRLYSVYAPQDANERIQFFHLLQRDVTRSSVMGGDWNVLLDTALDYFAAAGRSYTNNEGASDLQDLMSMKRLRDVYREHNPRGRTYTRLTKYILATHVWTGG